MAQLTKADVYALLAQHGITGDLARCMASGAYAESRWQPDAQGDVQPDGTICSWGLWQMNRCGGLGTGFSPSQLCDPDFAVEHMASAYRGAYLRLVDEGYTDADLCWRVCAAAERPYGGDDPNSAANQGYRAAWALAAPDADAPVARTYDPDTSAELQVQDWVCSIRTATWCLRSIGLDVTAGQMETEMVAAGLVSSDVGLHDGSGAALAAWLSERFGVTAHSLREVPWEMAHDFAGLSPLALGSGPLDHWLAVRQPEGDGLALMNPAPNWQGVGDALDRATFERWAPWNAVWIELGAAPEEDDDMGRVAELETTLAEMQRIAREELIGNLEAALAVPRLPALAREKLAAGALPAAQTLSRLGAPEDGE